MQVVTTRECLTGEGGITRQFSGIPSTPSTIVTTRQCLPPPTPSPTPVTACCEHTLLDSAVHTDTLTGSVVAGALIIGNATPKWALLAPGTPGQALIINAGGIPTWTGLAASTHTVLDSTVHTDTLTAAVVRGGLMVGNATPKWALVVVDTNNRILINDGTDTLWGKVNLTLASHVTGSLGVPNGGTGAATLTGIVQGNAALAMTAITGTANYLPKWSATAPYLTATSLVFDSGSFVGINTALPLTELHVRTTSAVDPRGIMSAQYSTDTSGARVHFRKARGTEALPTIVVTADILGQIMFSGYDSSNYLQMASITVGSSGTIAATRVPTYMAFSTATNVAPSVLTEAMRIDSSQRVGIGIGVVAIVQQFEVGGVASPRMSVKSNTTNSDMGILLETSDLSRQAAITYNFSLGNALSFHTAGIGTAQTRMTIGNTGNTAIGLGAVAASNRLHVSIDDAVTAAVTTVSRIDHSSSGTPGVGFGGGLLWALESSTTINQDAGAINVSWTDATHATRTSAMLFQTVNSAAAITNRMALSGAGGLSVGDGTTTTAVGVINAVTGYRVASAVAASGTYLAGDGTNFVPTAFPAGLSTPVSIANGGTFATSFSTTNGLVKYDGTRLVTSSVFTSASVVLIGDGGAGAVAFRTLTTFDGILAGAFNIQSSSTAATANAGGQFSWTLRDTSSNDYGDCVYIQAKKSTSWTSTASTRTAELLFSVYTAGAGTQSLFLKSANVVCGNDSTLASRTDDWLYVCSSNGAPSTTPITEFGSRAAISYDTSNKTLIVYDPTDNTWRSVVLT